MESRSNATTIANSKVLCCNMEILYTRCRRLKWWRSVLNELDRHGQTCHYSNNQTVPYKIVHLEAISSSIWFGSLNSDPIPRGLLICGGSPTRIVSVLLGLQPHVPDFLTTLTAVCPHQRACPKSNASAILETLHVLSLRT